MELDFLTKQLFLLINKNLEVLMKNTIFVLTCAVLVILSGCSKTETYDNLEQLSDKKFAVPTGTIADELVKSKFPEAKFDYYNSVLDACMAVKTNKADAAAYDEPILRNIVAKTSGLKVLPSMITYDNYGFAMHPDNLELKKTIDQVLSELKSTGKYDEMMKRWFPEHGSPASMPDIEYKAENGIIHFGTSAVTEPFSFIGPENKVTGFDIEFATYVAQKLGKELKIVDMDFGAMIPSLISKKVDYIGACITISEERKKKVLFSETYYKGGIAALVKDSQK
jgi:ABC-type amino acid transport substrate-binding protein